LVHSGEPATENCQLKTATEFLPLNMIFDLSQTKSIANTFISELRDESIQKDSMRFRKNLERLGAFFAFEISKTLSYKEIDTQTPLGIAKSKVLTEQPVLATILRAGLPLQQGLLSVFDQADCAFITAYRKTKKSGDFIIQMEHISAPDLEGKTVILADPMLATGLSIVLCAKELINSYQIKKLHIVAAIASSEGVKHVQANLPKADLWLGAIDDEMTSKSYIVPGLGDAGDLAFGIKA
jgi:uracil phosphoribosyltransferase